MTWGWLIDDRILIFTSPDWGFKYMKPSAFISWVVLVLFHVLWRLSVSQSAVAGVDLWVLMLFASHPAEGTKELCEGDRTLQGSSVRCFFMCIMSVCMCAHTSCLSRFVVQSDSLLSLTSFASLLHSVCKQCSLRTAFQPPCCPTSSAVRDRQRVRGGEIMIHTEHILRCSDWTVEQNKWERKSKIWTRCMELCWSFQRFIYIHTCICIYIYIYIYIYNYYLELYFY